MDLVLASCIALGYAGFLVRPPFPDTLLRGQLWVGHPGYPLGLSGSQRNVEAEDWACRSRLEAWVLSKGGSLLLMDSAVLLCFRVNVCGGQCCHGWSKAPGSQRCTKRKFLFSQWPCMVGRLGLPTWQVGVDPTGVT